MANQSVIELLRDRERFTQIEWGIVSYLYENRSQVSGLTIAQLARATYSSNGSIMNVCKKLGCSGFRDLKYKIIAEAEGQKYIQRHVNLTTPFDIDEPAESIANQMASLYKEAVDLTRAALDPREVQAIVDAMLAAERIFVFGVGDSKITCEAFINKLVKIDRYAILATQNYDENPISSSITRRDVSLFVSYSGVNKSFTVPLRRIHRNGGRIVGITADVASPVARYSDNLVLLADLESNDRIATFYSQAAIQYVLNVIYALLYAATMRKGSPVLRAEC